MVQRAAEGENAVQKAVMNGLSRVSTTRSDAFSMRDGVEPSLSKFSIS